jgi:hypothetical protein
VEEEETRLCGDRDPDLVGQSEPTAPLEDLLGEEDLHVPQQLRLVRRRQAAEDRQVPLDDLAPRGGDRLRAQAATPAVLQEAKDHGRAARLHVDRVLAGARR